jgi:hypothetical protein
MEVGEQCGQARVTLDLSESRAEDDPYNALTGHTYAAGQRLRAVSSSSTAGGIYLRICNNPPGVEYLVKSR